MKRNYLTIATEIENLTVIERSKFICRIKPVENEEDAKRFVDSVKKQHSLATHNCYAFIADELGLVQKFSDDGEPQGTAGLPMLEVLKNRKIYKVAVVVTRYFGGIKLGAGGLVRAYSGAVCDCLDKAKIVDMQQVRFLCIASDYDKYSLLLKLEGQDATIIDTQYSNGVAVTFAVKEEYLPAFNAKLSDLYSGNAVVEDKGEGYYAFKN